MQLNNLKFANWSKSFNNFAYCIIYAFKFILKLYFWWRDNVNKLIYQYSTNNFYRLKNPKLKTEALMLLLIILYHFCVGCVILTMLLMAFCKLFVYMLNVFLQIPKTKKKKCWTFVTKLKKSMLCIISVVSKNFFSLRV